MQSEVLYRGFTVYGAPLHQLWWTGNHSVVEGDGSSPAASTKAFTSGPKDSAPGVQ